MRTGRECRSRAVVGHSREGELVRTLCSLHLIEVKKSPFQGFECYGTIHECRSKRFMYGRMRRSEVHQRKEERESGDVDLANLLCPIY